jgi:LysM repeat protein
VTDESGNCWLQSRKTNGEWVGNFWSPGRVSFAISGYGRITGFFGNGFTYYLVNNGNGVIVREEDFSNPQQSRELGLTPYTGQPVSLGGSSPAGSPASGNSLPQCSGGTVHVVAPGETLLRIAQRYSTTVNTIAGINNLVDRNRINVGQSLTIACGQAAAPQGEQPPSVPASPPQPPPSGGGSCAQDTVHVVRSGENLFRIALRYGTTIDAIASVNSIVDPTKIGTGQQLRIPCIAG